MFATMGKLLEGKNNKYANLMINTRKIIQISRNVRPDHAKKTSRGGNYVGEK